MKFQMIITRISILVLTALAVFSLPGPAASQPVTTLRLDPAAAAASTCADTQIVVKIEDVENLWAYHVQFTYDPAVIEVTGMENGSFLQKGLFLTDKGTPGMFYIANSQIAGVEPASGSGDLAVFNVRALAPGLNTSITFDTTVTILVDETYMEPGIEYQAVDGAVNTIGCDSVFLYLPLVLRQ